MCSILGWIGHPPYSTIEFMLRTGSHRGRDGFGCRVFGDRDIRINGKINSESLTKEIMLSKIAVCNFRATPTTEAESSDKNLQPYGGFVHNGIIANDKDWGNYPIDSMVLPEIFREDSSFDNILWNLNRIRGSYALAYENEGSLILACNYKPIYYSLRDDYFIFASTPNMLPIPSSPVPPYSAMMASKIDDQIITFEKTIPLEQNKKVLVSASSGLDSTTVAYMLKYKGYLVTLVHFRYGCLAETREIERIYKIADEGGFGLEFIDMPRNVMAGSITKGDYHKNEIEGTEYAMDWVSARNLLMLSILTAYAETNNFSYIAFGGNLEESGAYPDNEEEFGRRFNAILPFATQNGVKIELLQPLSNLMKHEIVKIGTNLGVPYELTWSCYGDGDIHCGSCGPCFMRRTAFERNGLKDPVFND